VIATAKQDMSRGHFREAGYWLDKTVDQLLTEAAASTPYLRGGHQSQHAVRANKDA